MCSTIVYLGFIIFLVSPPGKQRVTIVLWIGCRCRDGMQRRIRSVPLCQCQEVLVIFCRNPLRVIVHDIICALVNSFLVLILLLCSFAMDALTYNLLILLLCRCFVPLALISNVLVLLLPLCREASTKRLERSLCAQVESHVIAAALGPNAARRKGGRNDQRGKSRPNHSFEAKLLQLLVRPFLWPGICLLFPYVLCITAGPVQDLQGLDGCR
mmetsp:Transcript_122743/g.244163  ORF Transcript_122743/g.244163 Transcript_122743/m.244163 type:complete len:213 (-) Transcript_122743:307-945(-)